MSKVFSRLVDVVVDALASRRDRLLIVFALVKPVFGVQAFPFAGWVVAHVSLDEIGGLEAIRKPTGSSDNGGDMSSPSRV
jgi:hypothetical protein